MDAIEANREAEPILADDDGQFRFLAENATDMLSRHTADGNFLYASPACRRLFGYTPKELVGRSAYEFIHPDETRNSTQAAFAHPDSSWSRKRSVRIRMRMPDSR